MEPPSPTRPGVAPEALLRDGRQRGGHAGLERRGDPALGGRLHVDGDVRPLVGADGRDQGIGRRLRVDVGRQAQRELQRRRGAQHVAAVARLGQPVGARHLEGGAPGARDEPVDRVGRRAGAARRRPARRCRGTRPRAPRGWPGAPRGSPPPGARAGGCGRSPRPRSATGCGAGCGTTTGRRRRPAPLWMPSVSTSTLHGGDEVPPQRRRQPQAVVAEPARVEADDEAGRADALLEVLEVGRQVGAAALLARLDEDEHAAPAAARRQQTRHGGERRVAVVGRAPAVEEVALAHRLVGPEPAAPLAERRLLVHVAVDDDRVAACRRCRSAGPGCGPGSSTISTCSAGVLVAHPRRAAARPPPRWRPARPSPGRRRGRGTGCGCTRSGRGGSAPPRRRRCRSRAASRLGDLGQPVERLGHARRPCAGRPCRCFRRKACLSWLMSHDSVTLVPPSTGSNS